ncbi:hypothetical protein Patl1_25653 [Pistacia atlantica]|uniref:Uncharacterized protein n=1 Tax=Pistacia atlantica TaxID=434234 RepID=A0ACC1B0F7_9ROSI|nr:hypothetical protein Patl1_25653 [Pistacia atlantica]
MFSFVTSFSLKNATARVTAELLQSVISQHREPSTNVAAALIEAVRSVGELLIDANPVELAVGSTVRRVLHIIREEDSSPLANAVGGLKLSAEIGAQDIIDGENNRDLSAAAIPVMRLSHPPSLCAILDSLSKSATLCQTSALGDGVEGKGKFEVILTFGHSRFVMESLCAAKEKVRFFDVFIVEGTPQYQGYSRSSCCDGQWWCGSTSWVEHGCRKSMLFHLLWLLVYMRYLCSLNPHNPEVVLNEPRSPSGLLQFEEFSDCMDYGIGSGPPLLHVVNPSFDYVSPELVTLFVTDVGGYKSSYIYRLIADYYPADDFTG